MTTSRQRPNHGELRGSAWCVLSPAIWLILTSAQGLVAQSPTIARQPQSLNVAPGMKAVFTVQASGSALRYQWQFNSNSIARGTNFTFTITNVVPADAGDYQVVITNSSGSVTSAPASLLLGPILAWGATNIGPDTPAQLLLPLALTNAIAIAAGDNHGLGLKPDGSLATWGIGNSALTNVPAGLSDVIAVSARRNNSGALRSDGSVVVWGNNNFQQTIVPPTLTNAISLGVGGDFCAALRSDGTVLAWGSNLRNQVSGAASLSDVVAIACGGSHGLALLGSGQVAAWGDNTYGQRVVPTGLANVVHIVAGDHHSLALRDDGTVVAWGNNGSGQTNVPAGLTNVVAIAAGVSHSLALTGDGRIVGWGLNNDGQRTAPAGATNVFSLAAGSVFSLALEGTGAPTGTAHTVKHSILQGETLQLAAMAVGAPPLTYQWRINGLDIAGETNAAFSLADVQPASAGSYSVVVSNNAGSTTNQVASVTVRQRLSVAAWGLNSSGQANVPPNLPPIKTISAGGSHTLALLEDGRVMAWGDNRYGQTNVPANATNVIAVSAGGQHSLVLRGDGTFLQWGGVGTFTQAPFGTATAIAAGYAYNLAVVSGTVQYWVGPSSPYRPRPPPGISGVKALAAGETYGAALKNDGTVVVWTAPFLNYGQTNIPTGLSNVVAIAAGFAHTLALKNDGTVVAWGLNNQGQTNVPTDLTNVVAVAAYQSGSAALRGDGQIITWGRDFFGELIVPNGLTNVAQISSGFGFNVALVGDSAPFISLPPRGRTILPDTALELTSTVSGTPPLTFQWQRDGVDISGSTNVSLLITNAVPADVAAYRVIASNRHGGATSEVATVTIGPIIVWGNNSTEQTWVPPGVTSPVQLAAGDKHSIALMADGSLVEWGGFIDLRAPTNLPRCAAIAAGGSHNVALLESGSVVAWGENFAGQASVPAGLTNAVAVAAGSEHSLALTADGNVIAWGYTNYARPDQIAGLTDIVQVAAGFQHSLALKADGTVVAWGSNFYGQTNVPAGLTDVVAVAAGSDHSLALKADGTVVVWGAGGSSQIQPPPGLANVVAIAAGIGGCMVLKTDGAVLAWGYNQYGQTNVPPMLNNVVRIASGWAHNLAIVGDGTPIVASFVPRRTVRVGGTLSLAALAVGAAPLRYQWQFNGADIPGATNSTLTLSDARLTAAGNYRCVISNSLDSLTGPVTTVIVVGEPLRFETAADAFQITNGVVHLRLTGLAGTGPVVFYTSTNLTEWNPVFTNSPTTGSLDFDDTTVTNQARFYRAIENP